MEILSEYAWIPVVILLLWICYNLWKAGRLRDPGQGNTYHAATKKQNPFACPYDIEERSCKYMGCPDGYINCEDCDWYNNGVRPSKF